MYASACCSNRRRPRLCQHPRPFFGDRHSVLEVSRSAAILRTCGPSVFVDNHFGGSETEDRLNSDDLANLQTGAPARSSVIGDVGLFVQFAPDSVSAVFLNHRDSGLVGDGLDGMGDVRQVFVCYSRTHTSVEGLLSGAQQALNISCQFTNGECKGAIAEPTVEAHAHVDAQHITFLQRIGSRETVNGFIVNGGTDRSRESVISLECRVRTVRSNRLLCQLVENSCRYSRRDAFGQGSMYAADDLTRGAYRLDLVGRASYDQ